MNTNMLVRALWQSLISVIIAVIIYIVISAITSKGSVFFLGTLLVAGGTFVVAFLISLIFSVVFGRK
ncbi:MAG: hypothetical protein ABI396_06880 [Ktedonobacteraceae bacterium]